MFLKRDLHLFISSAALIIIGYLCMILDPTEYGFGILTLWIAPPLLLAGLLIPIIAISGIQFNHCSTLVSTFKSNPEKYIAGIIVFAIALTTYVITLEPTASLWDCSEFIAAAYKLQIPHSPGAPLFLLIGRLFSMFALNDTTKVAWMINFLSALFSALTVYIVFHLIYYFGSRTITTSGALQKWILILSALCGSMCLTFSDSFWFSAVEAETYAAAAFFMVLLVWLIVTGKDLAGDSRSRRLILISYLAGLSFCAHPMCLLTLSILPFCWYSHSKKITITSTLLTIGAGMVIVMVINRLITTSFFGFMFTLDKFIVDIFHAPYYSGAFIVTMSLALLFTFLLRRYKTYSSYIWCAIFLFMGFLPYVMLFIRSNFNPPIDETNPENLPLIKAYMNRESYGSVPLLYGPYFDAEVKSLDVKAKMYYKDKFEYKLAGTISSYQYDDKRQTILPRMYSNDKNNIAVYRQWTGLKENQKPNFINNVTFMLRFQLGEMYLRYLMFNFAGRESDVQYSSWLKPWDNLKLSVPNKARNQYWMIPLLMGLIGVFYHGRKHKKDFIALCTFFLMTGVILVIYLNSPPNEPRERDYIYVGSFIAYCIWIGLGVVALASYVSRYKTTIVYSLASVSLLIPAWMAYENFDDHNRSGRTFQIDNARNVLQSCAPNAILFTGGDNDTFPLWYLQEVENFRTDVRVMVLSYMNTDWYINQLRRQNYNSAPFKLSLSEKDYLQYGPNDVLYVQNQIKEGIDAKEYLRLLHTEHPALRLYSNNDEPYSILPSGSLNIAVIDSDLTLNRTVAYSPSISVPDIKLNVIGSYLPKGPLAIIDLIISNHWQRPIYFNMTSQNQIELDISPYLVQEGLVYRLTPYANNSSEIKIDAKLMYQNLITNADYKNILRPDMYLNYEDYQARMIDPLRSNFNNLAIALLNEGDEKKAIDVLNYAVLNLYSSHLKPSYANLQTAEILLSVGKNELANKLASAVFDSSFLQAKVNLANNNSIDNLAAYILQKSADILTRMGHSEYKEKLKQLGLMV